MDSSFKGPTTLEHTYLSLIRTYENNPLEFHKTLLSITGSVSSKQFWETLHERRLENASILLEHTFQVLNEDVDLGTLFSEAQKSWTSKDKKKAAASYYDQLDPINYLQLLDSLISIEQPVDFSQFLVAHVLKMQERKEFSLLFRSLLKTLLKAPINIVEMNLSAISKKIPESKFNALIEAEWNSLSLTSQCRIIPYLPIDFIFSKASKGNLMQVTGWLHSLMTTLKYMKPRTCYFKEYLEIINTRFLVSEIAQAITPFNGSAALIHFLSDLDMYQFNSFVTLGADPMTNFLYAVEFDTSEEATHTLNMIREGSRKYEFFLNESQIYIYEDDAIAGVESPFSFTEFIDSAMINQSNEGDLLDIYIERIRNLPPVLFLIYASDIRLFSWVVKCSIYLEEKSLRYLAYSLSPEESLIIFSYLWRRKKITQAANYLLASPEETKVILLKKVYKWFKGKHEAAKNSEAKFEDLVYSEANYKPLYDAMQETISLRREIDGPIARHILTLSKDTFANESITSHLTAINNIIQETRLSAEAWMGPNGAIALVYQLEPTLSKDPTPSIKLPVYLLSQLNSRILSFANLSSAEKLKELGLVSEKDFEVLGLDKEHQLKIDNIEMQINNLHPEEIPYEIAILWEEIKKGGNLNIAQFHYQVNNLKNLLQFKEFDKLSSGEEADIRFKLQKIIQSAITVYGISPDFKMKLENLCQLGAPISTSFEVLVGFVREYSFENRLKAYLTQPFLHQLWDVWKLHNCTSINDIFIRHKLTPHDLYKLKIQFNPEINQ